MGDVDKIIDWEEKKKSKNSWKLKKNANLLESKIHKQKTVKCCISHKLWEVTMKGFAALDMLIRAWTLEYP